MDLRGAGARGAPESILTDAKPHVGTDMLHIALQNLRQELLSLGAQVRFGHRLEGLESRDGVLTGLHVRTGEGTYRLPVRAVVLAPGHSARDTFQMLYEAGVPMEAKPFAVGVRIEHRQRDMDAAQYRQYAGHPCLPASTYKLSCHTAAGRGVFSFCVCPGGQVVAAASEPGRVVTNGMSHYARSGENINGGMLVGVTPEDFGTDHPLAGVAWQRQLEEAAFRLGGGGFLAPPAGGGLSAHRPSTGRERCRPAIARRRGATSMTVCRRFSRGHGGGAPLLERKLRGYAQPDALTAVDRLSSPVRILRRADKVRAGAVPCGEGAGYAGGILSAARRYAPRRKIWRYIHDEKACSGGGLPERQPPCSYREDGRGRRLHCGLFHRGPSAPGPGGEYEVIYGTSPKELKAPRPCGGSVAPMPAWISGRTMPCTTARR
ncbi:MAG: NAD(P)/FAD-dependent oxidoreductase [Oscillospiraceae bacterium]